MVEQKWQKNRLVKAEPLPLSEKWKKRLHECYDKFHGSLDLLFQRGAVVFKFGKNFIFRSKIANF